MDAARELTARQGKGIAEIVDPSGFRQQAIEFMERLCAEGRPPFDLVRETERARHQLASGKLAMNAYGREKEIPRRQISQKHLKRLGYGPAGASGSAGVASFEKRSVEGTIFSCDFDFGTWRSTVMASFGYSQRNLRLRFPLRYDLSGADSAIITGDLLDRTMANVAFVLGELEAFLDRKE